MVTVRVRPATVTVKTGGVVGLLRRLEAISDEARREVWEVLREEGDATAEDAKGRCPKRTGKLAATIKVEEGRDAMQVFVTAGSKKRPYAHLVEFGHAKKGGGMVEGKPYMTPAGQAARPRVTRRLEEILKREGK
jgi:hypothetical protein